jgi:folate-binding protein YgfZ
MAYTPLLEAIRAQSGTDGFPIADYRGAGTVARFGDPQAELGASQSGCGIYDLGFRARISLAGGDRSRWLNGMVTNNIRDLAVGRGVYAFLLNPQGRILGDMYAFNLGEKIVVETDGNQVEKIISTFDHFIIMDDVEMKDVGAEQTAIGIAGPKSRAVLNAAGIEVPEMQPLQVIAPQCNCDCGCVECTVIRGEDEAQESYEIWLSPKDVLKTWQGLMVAGATAVGSEALEMLRIVNGVPLYGVDIRERELPQETEQARALNFNKGCYVGQEIVERIRSRGNVHRKFAGFVSEGAAAIKPGDKIIADEKEVGGVTSVTVLRAHSSECTLALGYIRREVGVPGRVVTISGIRARVSALPFAIPLGQAENSLLQRA